MQLIETIDGTPKIVEDRFSRVLPEDDADLSAVELPQGALIVSLELWRARRDELIARDDELGLWLDADVPVDDVADEVEHFDLIALDFPHFKDGRSFSKARLLRERDVFTGRLRAVGDVQYDQLYFMARCGFDGFEPAETFDIHEALEGFKKYTVTYQPAVDEEQPLFRRVERS
jgi:uncharacterized protein (DUF934 family)